MKRLACPLFIALLIFSRAFAADDKLASGAASLYHLASILGIEVSREQVENIVLERARGPYVVNFVIIDTAGRIGIELQERDLDYEQLQTLETPVIACLKTTLDDESDSEADTTVIADFIVVESATEKSVRVFGAPQKSSRAAATFISRDHFLEHWTGQVLTLRPALSAEATQLLQDIITGTAAYNAKLKSGEVEFSITLSERIRQEKNFLERLFGWGRNLLMSSEKEKEEVQYEDQGYWHITYRFDGDHQFYDVKMRKKRELNGKSLLNWHEMHLQYQINGRTVYFRENPKTEWQQQSAHKSRPPWGADIPSDVFEEQFNPRRWSPPPWGSKFTRMINFYKPVDVQRVKVKEIPHNLLTLQRTDFDATHTIEIWLDPQKAYRPTRILAHRRSLTQLFIEGRDGKITPLPREKTYRLTSYIYQFAQFEPDIWFPKTVTMEHSSVVGDEDKQPPSAHRRTTMQVHRAVFNMPISEKELGIIPDR
ncbi:MAG: hypothetical protein OXH39_22885 [Candidatus Poribacteria bacterium]|nr:hypothetical protein [Candidatus Poribacteria bacterium]